MLYHIRAKGQETRFRSGRMFGPELVEIDTEGMSQEAVEAILNDDCLRCIPYVPESKVEEVIQEVLDKVLVEVQAKPDPEPEVVSEAEAVPEHEVVEVQKDEVETKVKAKKSRDKSAPPQEQAE